LRASGSSAPAKSEAGLRTVALPEYLRPVLVAHLEQFVQPGPGALVFATKSGRPLYNANWCSTFARAKRQIGLDDCHFHDLRHAAATLAAQSGATLKDSMYRLGHSSPRAALGYQHTQRGRDEMIAQALNQAAEAVREGKVVPLKPRKADPQEDLAAQA
jgi:integrase